MAWNKRAQAETPFWYGLFYLPLTAIVILAIVIIPKNLMDKSVEPIPLDQQIQAKQTMSRLWETSTITGRTSPFQYTDDLTGINNTYSSKQMTYLVKIGDKETIHNKKFYEIAQPIAPFRYLPYSETRQINVKGTEKQLTIEEYYPKEYEVKPT